MRRVALLCMGLVMGAASAAEAQLTMQMSNGWSFTFGGNVNAFLVYDNYEALLDYNCAHTYALSVGLLADRL